MKDRRRILRSTYEFQRFNEAANDPRKTWKLYKEIVFNRKETISEPIITINGIQTTNTKDSCNDVNQRFCTTGSILAADIIGVYGYSVADTEDLYPNITRNSWSFSMVNVEDVIRVINGLPNKKSTSFDRIPISLLKKTTQYIAPAITSCFNESIRTSTYPSNLLKGRLKLIHKAGDNDLGNFRGLSILPNESKVYEQLLVDQLLSHLNSMNFFVGDQYGFLKQSSCEGAATKLVDTIKSQFKKKYVACIFVDLKRAFDTIDAVIQSCSGYSVQ